MNQPSIFGEIAGSMQVGDLSWNDFLQKIAKDTNQNVEQVRKLYESEKIDIELLTYIDIIHQKYKTALLSNASQEHISSLVKRTHLNKIFDEVLISSEIGLAKPDPAIFEHALEKLNVKPQEAVFIDDLQKHVNGARLLGMHAVQYQNYNQLRTELGSILSASND
ncbi:HAD-IA family hydrolase [Candidatus Saccharibacteria bacterium]|nr:HAD-IA family hydrolase [Candidatus Saccharibacteria bacterium]